LGGRTLNWKQDLDLRFESKKASIQVFQLTGGVNSNKSNIKEKEV
jgi:hypothetical protein